jgi:YD repeat-containing protein
VLNLAGLPLANVALEVEYSETKKRSGKVFTDETGRFLLANIDAGWQELNIDGRRARLRTNPQSSSTGPNEDHGVYEYGLRVANGKTTVLPFTIWLTKIDGANALKIASPTVSEVVLTTPKIPNFEIRIPPGTVINDHEGKVVTEVSITPVPVDRPPFPMPLADFPIFYTAQPGTGYLTTTAQIGARVHYPNVTKQIPGINADLWHYNPHYRGWYRYGFGTVNNEGTQIVPDPGVSVYTFKGASFGFGGGVPPAIAPKCKGPGCMDLDPVDLQTGLFVHTKTDLVVPDVMPIKIARTYRNEDSNIRAFGRGATLDFDMFFIGDNVNYMWAQLILPDGGRIDYHQIPPFGGSDISKAVLEATENPQFYKSRVTWNGTGWDLKLTDGTVYVLGEKAPVQSIRDRFGNQLTVSRTMGQKGNITRITASPSGRYLDFTYDASNRISQITDNGGRTVSYQYDSNSRLWRVTDPMGGVTEYAYDASHRMLSLKDPKGIVYIANEYTNGRVTKQTLADGSNYQVMYTTDGSGNVTQTDVTDPRGNITRSEFNTGEGE